MNQEALAPLAVLAQRVGLCELVGICANAMINRYVPLSVYLYFIEGCLIHNERFTRGQLETDLLVFSFAFHSLDAIDISACLRVANAIQNEPLSTGIADYIITKKKISAENLSLIHQLGENVMDDIFQFGPFTEKEKLLMLIAWFDTLTEKNDSQATFEESVGRLINRIDCTNFDSKFIMDLLGKPSSRFSDSRLCR